MINLPPLVQRVFPTKNGAWRVLAMVMANHPRPLPRLYRIAKKMIPALIMPLVVAPLLTVQPMLQAIIKNVISTMDIVRATKAVILTSMKPPAPPLPRRRQPPSLLQLQLSLLNAKLLLLTATVITATVRT